MVDDPNNPNGLTAGQHMESAVRSLAWAVDALRRALPDLEPDVRQKIDLHMNEVDSALKGMSRGWVGLKD